MEKKGKLFVLIQFVLIMVLLTLFACAKEQTNNGKSSQSDGEKTISSEKKPIQFSMTYSDNPSLPFQDDWLAINKAEKLAGVDIDWLVIPSTTYADKVNLDYNSGSGADVYLFSRAPEALAMNGMFVAISDYPELTPNFNKLVKDWNLDSDIKAITAKDGKLYFIPSLYDKPFYDGGLLLREDLLDKYEMDAPKTFDDFYEYLKRYKQDNPSSYPLTILVEPRVHYRFSMPSFGISLGKNAATASYVLSWDYDKEEYFAGAVSEEFKTYASYMAKLYAEGLLDPEMINKGDVFTTKLATGASIASYGYYDQIGGIEGNSDIEDISFNLFPPLEGPAGAHSQEKSKVAGGIVIPAYTAERDDFKDILKALDIMFYSPEAVELWSSGVEGITFHRVDGNIVFKDEYVNAPEGLYKKLQTEHGLGTIVTQLVWVNANEMLKYDKNYAQINNTVAAMPESIRSIPPTPLFEEIEQEEATLLMRPLADAWEVWMNDFIVGKKSLNSDWDDYVKEMESKGIYKLLDLYNENRR